MSTIPDAAIEAAAEAITQYHGCRGIHEHSVDARTAIEAAMPAIREAIAQEIEAQGISADAGRNPMTGQESPDAMLHAAYNDGIQVAARIVRGGTP